MKFRVGDFVFVFEVSVTQQSHGFGTIQGCLPPQLYEVQMRRQFRSEVGIPVVRVKEESVVKAWQTHYGTWASAHER